MKKKNELYHITNIDLFLQSTRVLVYSGFGEKEQSKTLNIDIANLSKNEVEEMDRYISMQETSNIARLYLKKKHNKYFISDSAYLEFIEALNLRMTSNILHKLVQDNLLETAFDEEHNDFIFWVKDEDQK
ncbi:MAG: hypothetical protein VKK05_09250 [Synechococcus sp.]|nr:hypothetical protein [Synechococcus sp.]